VLDGHDVDIGITPSVVGSIRGRRSLESPVVLGEPLFRLWSSERRSLYFETHVEIDVEVRYPGTTPKSGRQSMKREKVVRVGKSET
jgi:hypothetical protein